MRGAGALRGSVGRRRSSGSPASAASGRSPRRCGRGAYGVRVRAVLHVRRPGRAQGRQRVRQPPVLRRRARCSIRRACSGIGGSPMRRRCCRRRPRDSRWCARGRGETHDRCRPRRAWSLATPGHGRIGCAGTGRELAGLVDPRRVGALVSRSITLRPRKGDADAADRRDRRPASCGRPGCRTPGIEAFLAEELPRFVRAADARDRVHQGEHARGVRPARPACCRARPERRGPRGSALGSGRGAGTHGPGSACRPRGGDRRGGRADVDGARLREAALVDPRRRRARPRRVRAGAHGITVLDSPPAMGVDAATLRPTLGPVAGWLSGPALKPLTLRAVFEVSRALPDTPIIARRRRAIG